MGGNFPGWSSGEGTMPCRALGFENGIYETVGQTQQSKYVFMIEMTRLAILKRVVEPLWNHTELQLCHYCQVYMVHAPFFSLPRPGGLQVVSLMSLQWCFA